MCHLTPGAVVLQLAVSSTPSSDLYQMDGKAAEQSKKERWVSPLLCSVSGLYFLCDICSPVKKHVSNVICLFLCWVISSVVPSLCSLSFLFCAFLPVGIHVHVPDPNPGGLGGCHGPDSGGCRSYVGSGCSHLLHPLPSVRHPGEEPTVLFLT